MPKASTKKASSRRPARAKTTPNHPKIHPHAAGIDIGATALHVAVPLDCDPQPVRTFATFTEDLQALADWLAHCGVQTVAMESTGVYWIPIFQILEARGLEVCLVNARHVKNVPGRKTDVSDCQWLQYLHSVGLLQASFRPPAHVCAVRSLWRHRGNLVRYASSHVLHMQKALTQMNLQLHNVISDLTGKTGSAIVEAIIHGVRDVEKLAALRDPRIKADAQTIAKSLVGDWKEEHLFTLRQAWASYAHYRQLVAECDLELARYLSAFETRIEVQAAPAEESSATSALPRKPGRPRALRSEVDFALRSELHRILGVDLTLIPGVHTTVVHTFVSEVGVSVERFSDAKHFASWLALCPDNRITGGKVLSAATRQVKSRTAHALRLAAATLHRSKSTLGDYFRRMKARLGSPAAITATAHKLARIIYHLVKNRCPYDASIFAAEEERQRLRREKNLHRQAAAMGLRLVPLTEGI
jgi:transposase